MRKSLRFAATPLLALSLAAISSTAMAESRPGEEQVFSAGGGTRVQSLAEARRQMREFESTHSVQCTESWSEQLFLPRHMWASFVYATCVPATDTTA